VTPDKSIYVLVFGGMADWEPAHALAELRRWGNRHVVAVGLDRSPVRTMGGLQITPDVALSEVGADAIELLILPGGDMWESGVYPRDELESLVRSLIAVKTPVAAICAATIALARAGVLDDRRHTSNALADLERHAPNYRGQGPLRQRAGRSRQACHYRERSSCRRFRPRDLRSRRAICGCAGQDEVHGRL
jgi:putative intracellular protease/amidase